MESVMEKLWKTQISIDSEIPSHEFLFQWEDVPCFARGELVAVTGKAKSGKTFVCSMLMAASQGVEVIGLRRINDRDMNVVWIDTEQSEDSTHEILSQRILPMIGDDREKIGNLHVYNLRSVRWQERLDMAIYAILSTTKPDLVIFDGIRDVVGDINNHEVAQTVTERMLSLASSTGACIVCVLHQNKSAEDKTLRGAIGTELQNKCFETYECVKDRTTKTFTIEQTLTRKHDLYGKVGFMVDIDGLPKRCHIAEKDDKAANPSEEHAARFSFNEKYLTGQNRIDKRLLFADVLARVSYMKYEQLRLVAMKLSETKRYGFMDRLIKEAVNEGILEVVEVCGIANYCMKKRTIFDP